MPSVSQNPKCRFRLTHANGGWVALVATQSASSLGPPMIVFPSQNDPTGFNGPDYANVTEMVDAMVESINNQSGWDALAERVGTDELWVRCADGYRRIWGYDYSSGCTINNV